MDVRTTGTGFTLFTGANTYTGETLVGSGTLAIGTTDPVSTAGTLGSGNVKGKLPLTPAPKDINFSKVLSDRLRFSFSDDDDDYDDDDEDDDSNEYCCESDGSFFDDYNSRFSVHARFQELDLSNCDSGQISVRSGGTPLRTKYVLLSSKSSTEWLKLTCNARETESVLRALSVISNMATDMKFSLNLNELNVIKRRMSVKSIFGAF